MVMKINKNLVLFLTGFMAYITIEVCFRGYSYPLMGICGGAAIVLLDKVNNRLSWDTDIIIQGLIGSALITIFELIVGELALRTSVVPVMWDYSNMPLNFDGVICVPFSLIWVVLSWAAILVADAITYYVFEELPVPYYKLFGKVVICFKEKQCNFRQIK